VAEQTAGVIMAMEERFEQLSQRLTQQEQALGQLQSQVAAGGATTADQLPTITPLDEATTEAPTAVETPTLQEQNP
jgi:uncharacterized coiled-coil protein SlyX